MKKNLKKIFTSKNKDKNCKSAVFSLINSSSSVATKIATELATNEEIRTSNYQLEREN